MSGGITNKEDIINSFLNAYAEIEKEIANVAPELLKWKPSEAAWSITEVITHLVDHSIVVSFRLREIVANSPVRLPAFDQDAWVSGQRANEEELAHVLAAAHALVRYNAYLISRLDASEWTKTGINAKGEPVSIAEIIPAFVNHIERHLGQIRRIKQEALAGEQV